MSSPASIILPSEGGAEDPNGSMSPVRRSASSGHAGSPAITNHSRRPVQTHLVSSIPDLAVYAAISRTGVSGPGRGLVLARRLLSACSSPSS